MCDSPGFSPAQRELLLELLERERAELPVEIRHTRTSALRDQLRERRKLVNSLLERLSVPAVI